MYVLENVLQNCNERGEQFMARLNKMKVSFHFFFPIMNLFV